MKQENYLRIVLKNGRRQIKSVYDTILEHIEEEVKYDCESNGEFTFDHMKARPDYKTFRFMRALGGTFSNTKKHCWKVPTRIHFVGDKLRIDFDILSRDNMDVLIGRQKDHTLDFLGAENYLHLLEWIIEEKEARSEILLT